MGDNSKELPNAKLHLQEKMREWLGANQEIYSKFKDKIQSGLKDSLRDNVEEQADEEMAAYQNAILEVEVLDKEDGQDNLIDRFMTAIKDRNVFACCLYCYLELDNGFEELADVMVYSQNLLDKLGLDADTPKTMKILPIFLPKHTRAT